MEKGDIGQTFVKLGLSDMGGDRRVAAVPAQTSQISRALSRQDRAAQSSSSCPKKASSAQGSLGCWHSS